MRVLRIYHAGRGRAHRARERALIASGVDVTLVVPAAWRGGGAEDRLSDELFRIVELAVERPGDVNRHRYVDPAAIAQLVATTQPDLVDIHEEPLSAVVHQLLSLLPPSVPVVTYQAQNLDKRYPPPFSGWERAAFGRISGIYACSRQAAAVARRRGFAGQLSVIPLGYDPAVVRNGAQEHAATPFRLALVGRMVPEKGVRDAVDVLAAVRSVRDARLTLVGAGPELDTINGYAAELGVASHLDIHPWVDEDALAEIYRASHVVLVPSHATSRWVEQFGRTVVEGQASGAVVAAYASGTIPEIAAGGAWLAAENDVTGLARAVTRIAGDSQHWTELRQRGAAAAAGKTWQAVAEAQREFYSAAVAATPRAPESPSIATRIAAQQEFGSPTRTGNGQDRPFAVPGLRSRPRLAGALGTTIDAAGSARRRLNRG